MSTQEALKKYDEHRQKMAAYQLALKTMSYDQATVAPKKGAAYRNQMAAILSGELFSLENDPSYLKLIEELSQMDLEDEIKREINGIKKQQDKTKYIPKDVFIKYAQLTRDGETAWEEAKEKKDYSLFQPILKQLVEMTQQIVSYRKDDRSVYDQLLDDFEPDFNTELYDEFFVTLKEKLVPFIQKILKLNLNAPAWLSYPVSIDVQRKLVNALAQHLEYDLDAGLISESAHPFSSGFSAFDNRVTVKYHENAFTSSLYALIHEIGHATYNGQVDEKWNGHYVADSMSFGMHESQSRFFENILGRDKAFWETLYPVFQKEVDFLKEITLEEFIFGVNYVENSLIRIEADELTYPLHIMVRYEIEKGLFNGSLSTEGLDEVWSDKMEAYLGIRPQNAAEGILQDIHWSGAAFGYFPTYALGSAYAAQWLKAINKDLNLSHHLSKGDLKTIKAWLKENIHQYGGLYSPKEMMLRVSKETFNPEYYVEYLIEKFSRIYPELAK